MQTTSKKNALLVGLTVVLLAAGLTLVLTQKKPKPTAPSEPSTELQASAHPQVTVRNWIGGQQPPKKIYSQARIFQFEPFNPEAEAKDLARRFLQTTEVEKTKDTYIAYHQDPVSTEAASLVVVDPKKGEFSYASTNGVLLRAGTDKVANVQAFIHDLYLDPTIKITATYRKKDRPGISYYEAHREWSAAGLPILNVPGLLSLPEDLSFSQLSLRRPLFQKEDPNIFATSDKTDGKTRLTDFNSITIGVRDSNNTIATVKSNIREVRTSVLTTTKLKSYEAALNELKQGQYEALYTTPAGNGVPNYEKVYPGNKGEIGEATITEAFVAYLEQLPQSPQSHLTPYYLFRGTGELQSGYKAKFIAIVPAGQSLNVQGVSSLAQLQQQDSSQKLGTFQVTPTLTPRPSGCGVAGMCPSPTCGGPNCGCGQPGNPACPPPTATPHCGLPGQCPPPPGCGTTNTCPPFPTPPPPPPTCEELGNCPPPPPPPPPPTCEELGNCPPPPTCEDLGTCPPPPPPNCEQLGNCPPPPPPPPPPTCEELGNCPPPPPPPTCEELGNCPPPPPPPPPPKSCGELGTCPPPSDSCPVPQSDLTNIREVEPGVLVGQKASGRDSGEWYYIPQGGSSLDAEQLLNIARRNSLAGEEDRPIRGIQRDIDAFPGCPVRITGISPTLFIYAAEGQIVEVRPNFPLTYTNTSLRQGAWNSDNQNEYIYYEYNPVHFSRPTQGWNVEKSSIREFVKSFSQSAGLTSIEEDRLRFEIGQAASSVKSDKLFVGLLPQKEIDAKLPLRLTEGTTSVRFHFAISPARSSIETPRVPKIERTTPMILELGAISQ